MRTWCKRITEVRTSTGRVHGLNSLVHPFPKRPEEIRTLFRANHRREPCLGSQRRDKYRHRAIYHRHNSLTRPAFISRIPSQSRSRNRNRKSLSRHPQHLPQCVNHLFQYPLPDQTRTIVQQELSRQQLQLGAARVTRKRIVGIVQSGKGKQNLQFHDEVSDRPKEDLGGRQKMESQNAGADGRERVRWNLMEKRVTR